MHVCDYVGFTYLFRSGVFNLSWRTLSTAHSVCLPHLTHMVPFISSFVETARPKLDVSGKGDIQNMQCWGSCRAGLKTHELDVRLSLKQ